MQVRRSLCAGVFSLLVLVSGAVGSAVEAPSAQAAVTNYFYNPIPMINGRQMGWAFEKRSNGYVRTLSGSRDDAATSFFCTNCWRKVTVTWLNGTGTTVTRPGNLFPTYAQVYVGTNNVASITHSIKFKVSSKCYVYGYVVNNAGSIVGGWGPQQQASC